MRFGHFPQHIGLNTEWNMHAIKTTKVRSGGMSEMDFGAHSNIALAKRVLSPEYLVLSDDLGQHSEEVPVILRRDRRVRNHQVKVYQLSDVVGDGGIGNDRWMTVATWEGLLGRKWFHAATHWAAAIQAADGTVHPTANHRAHAMIGASRKMETEIGKLIGNGYQGCVTGDFNYRLPQHVPDWHYGPNQLFERLGMRRFSDGLDWMGWTKGVKKRSIKVYQPGTKFNRSDHPWFVGTFSLALG